MSGTSGRQTVRFLPVPLTLPAPQVGFRNPVSAYAVADETADNTSLVTTQVEREVWVTAPGVPAAILEDPAKFGLQLELMRYRRKTGRQDIAVGNSNRSGGYVHPSHGPAPTAGSFTHGGAHGGASLEVRSIRPTEWPILDGADTVNVTQGILGFMAYSKVVFREALDLNVAIKSIVCAAKRQKAGSSPGKTFGYANYLGGYFAFRFSIRDITDDRAKRVWGPMSIPIYCAGAIHPFAPNGSTVGGQAIVAINPVYVEEPRASFWIGGRAP